MKQKRTNGASRKGRMQWAGKGATSANGWMKRSAARHGGRRNYEKMQQMQRMGKWRKSREGEGEGEGGGGKM